MLSKTPPAVPRLEAFVASSFSILHSHFADSSASALQEEICLHTGSTEEAASILRGIIRLGGDSSIRRYEMTPASNKRAYAGSPPVAWNVRAVRL